MRIATSIKIRVKDGFLPHLTNEIYKRQCAIRNITLLESESNDLFQIEIIYQSVDKYNGLLNKIAKYEDNFQIISSENKLEKEIEGGLLNISGKMPVENIVDYELNVLGASDLILNLLDTEKDKSRFSGISRNIGLFCALPDENEIREDYYKVFTLLERDSVIMNRFSGMNSFPLLVKASQIDDLLKMIQKLQFTFSGIRLFNFEDMDDILSFERLYSETTLPLLSQYYDEIPLYLLIAILQLFKKNNIEFNTCTVGLIGLNISSIRIARLFSKLGAARVLGNDNSIKLMHAFEKEGGLATSIENIYNSSDVLIFFKKRFETENLRMIGSGQLVVSLVKEEMDINILKERGVRDYLQSGWMDFSSLFPGILTGLINSDISHLDDDKIIKLSKKISALKDKDEILPDVFSDLHKKIPKLISELI